MIENSNKTILIRVLSDSYRPLPGEEGYEEYDSVSNDDTQEDRDYEDLIQSFEESTEF